MASVKDLKKDVRFMYGDLYDVVNFLQLTAPQGKEKAYEGLTDELIAAYDATRARISQKPAQQAGAYFKKLRKDFEKEVAQFVQKLNSAGA